MPNDTTRSSPSSAAFGLPEVGEIITRDQAANLDDLKTKVSDDLSSAQSAIRDGANSAMEKVQETLKEQTNFASHQISGVGAAMQKVGAELEKEDQPQVGRYAKQMGDSVQGFAKKVEGKNLGEIGAMVEEFGRKQPLAYLGIAAIAGLAVSRFLTASATRAPSADDAHNDQQGRIGTSTDRKGGHSDGNVY